MVSKCSWTDRDDGRGEQDQTRKGPLARVGSIPKGLSTHMNAKRESHIHQEMEGVGGVESATSTHVSEK